MKSFITNYPVINKYEFEERICTMRETNVCICSVTYKKESHSYSNKIVIQSNIHEEMMTEVPTTQVNNQAVHQKEFYQSEN